MKRTIREANVEETAHIMRELEDMIAQNKHLLIENSYHNMSLHNIPNILLPTIDVSTCNNFFSESNILLSTIDDPACSSCESHPVYAYIGEEYQFCSNHKKEGMLCRDVTKNLCYIAGCTRYSIYNYEGLPKRFCSFHMKNDMIQISSSTGLRNYERCVICKKFAKWNYFGEEYKFCSNHRKEGMIKKEDNQFCIIAGCTSYKRYNFPCLPKKYCSTHKKDGMDYK